MDEVTGEFHKFKRAIEDLSDPSPGDIICEGNGDLISLYVGHFISDGTYLLEGPIQSTGITEDVQNQLEDLVLSKCAYISREQIILDINAILLELKLQHWIPKNNHPHVSKFFIGKNNTVFNVKAMGEYVLTLISCKTLEDTGEVLYQNNGVYRSGGERVIGQIVQNLLGDRSRKSYQTEVINWIKHATYVNREKFNPSLLINVLNGVLDLCTGELLQHSPDLLFTIQHPVNYDPNAKCPKISEFLRDILDDDKAETICEFSGYSLTTDTDIQKSVIVYGAAGAGKSTLLNLCTALVGSDNISNESLHSLENDRFAIANLCNKTLNVFPDLPDRPLSDIPIFKQIVGGDRLRGEMKYLPSFTFKPTVKMLFSANALPPIKSMDDAKSRRLILIRVKGTVPNEKKNRHLLNELTTPDELSGFLNLSLKGLKRLWDCGHYSYEMSTEETKIEYIAHSDPVKAFTQQCIVYSAINNIKKKDMFDAFCNWCNYYGIEPQTEQQLSRGMVRLTFAYNRESTGDRERYWEECNFSDWYSNNLKSVQDSEKTNNKLDVKKHEQETSPSNLTSFLSHCCKKEENGEEDGKYNTIGENCLKLDGSCENRMQEACGAVVQDSKKMDGKLDMPGSFCVDCGCSEGIHQSVLLNKEVVYRCQSCWEKYQRLTPVKLPEIEVV